MAIIDLTTPESKMITRVLRRAKLELAAALSALDDQREIAEVDELKRFKRRVPAWQMRLYIDAQQRQLERMGNGGRTNRETKRYLLNQIRESETGY